MAAEHVITVIIIAVIAVVLIVIISAVIVLTGIIYTKDKEVGVKEKGK